MCDVRIAKVAPWVPPACSAGRKPWELTKVRPSGQDVWGDIVLLCPTDQKVGTWPVGAAALASECIMLHVEDYPACMKRELDMLTYTERRAVDALVDKWSRTTDVMFLTRFMQVCECEWDLQAAGLVDILPHPRTCNQLSRVTTKPRRLLLGLAEHVQFLRVGSE